LDDLSETSTGPDSQLARAPPQDIDNANIVSTASRSEEIHITYNSHATDLITHTYTQALYLIAWLAAQLGWE